MTTTVSSCGGPVRDDPVWAAEMWQGSFAPPATPALTVVPPAAIAADPSNRLTLDLSNGGRVVILMRPDAAPNMVERVKTLENEGYVVAGFTSGKQALEQLREARDGVVGGE